MNPSKFFVAGTSLAGGSGLVGVWYAEGGKSPSEEKIKTVSEKQEVSVKSQDAPTLNVKPEAKSQPVTSSIEVGSGYTCHIFEVDQKTVNKVLSEITDQLGFLNGLDEKNQTFKSDVENACKGLSGKVSFTVDSNTKHVYVYKDGASWVYSANVQTQDWTKSTNFKGSSASQIGVS
ncbi:hypothetical protein MHF_1108 [Mycoplasma haemofelis Ohio2]|uniref:Uncharacterized protein n=1 Tax=Mycoplasma haemofelis (strain Ohio2) TaxID=859194 RepID=F6FJK0_MYCHI|nr:hypothetical protein MHF_1108 [Mycoplasma haemofelis Ohio2]